MTATGTNPAGTNPAGADADPVRWLVDRAPISDLLVEFARRLDTRDFAGYADLYMPDGVLELPGGPPLRGREEIRVATEKNLGAYVGTWHLSAAHTIDLDGDTAHTRSSLFAVHVIGDRGATHADGAGWYDNDLVRTAEGWRFTAVRVRPTWTAGEALKH